MPMPPHPDPTVHAIRTALTARTDDSREPGYDPRKWRLAAAAANARTARKAP
ncbi:MAG: hypothetical protein QOH97_4885 [Actinoplanes sp.]|jgi:hypothetical protein|nr:hypothetical protein [Actinoplanes sp.]